MTALDIYLFGFLLDLKSNLESITCFLVLILFILISVTRMAYIDKLETRFFLKKWCIFCISLFCIVAILKIFAPSKEIVTAMFVVPPIVNNEQVQELPTNVLTFVNEWLKQNTSQMNINKSK